MLSLLGLQDSYIHDGRVVIETIDDNVQPLRIRRHKEISKQLASVYKQINAPFGQLGLDSLKVSTAALASDTSEDAMYNVLSDKIHDWTDQRDEIAAEMKAILNGAVFYNTVFNEIRARQLIDQAQALLDEVSGCAADPTACAQAQIATQQ